MANIKSAKKRIGVINKKTAANRRIKSSLKAVIKNFYKAPRKSTMELEGSVAVAYPTKEIIPVKVTRRQFITKVMEFSLPTTADVTLVRATHIGKNDFGSLLGSLKFYKKLHPKEK